jgi:hypothetical protein
MAVLNAYMNDKFIKELTAHICEDFPAECQKYSLDENNLAPFIKNGLTKAKEKYGIEYKDDLTFFIECMVLLTPDFDQNDDFQWVKDILLNENLSGTEKMAEIDQYMIFNLETPI